MRPATCGQPGLRSDDQSFAEDSQSFMQRNHLLARAAGTMIKSPSVPVKRPLRPVRRPRRQYALQISNVNASFVITWPDGGVGFARSMGTLTFK